MFSADLGNKLDGAKCKNYFNDNCYYVTQFRFNLLWLVGVFFSAAAFFSPLAG